MANDTREATRMSRHAKSAHKKPKRHLWVRILRVVAILFVVGVAAGVGLFAYYAKDAPTVSATDLKASGGPVVYDKDNKEITKLGTAQTYVQSAKIPQTLKDAVVSIEDRRFYSEKFGVDPIRIAGAAVNNVLGRSNGMQGGSTLTQQLIKLAVFSTKASDQTLRRKAQEAWLAYKINKQYSKAQILEYYINKVYMDNGQYGMETAAEYYYDKPLSKLTLPQLALLAGMPQSPVTYDPYTNPEAATTRRNEVINAMLRDKKITSADAATAKSTAITLGLVKQQKAQQATNATDKIIDPYLVQVIAEVKKKLQVNPYTTSMKIYTNLDMSAQTRLYDIVNSNKYVTFTNNKMQEAVTMTDPNTGAVLAQSGGRKLGNVRLGFNRATRNTRSNGSTMKPLMDYGPAIEYLNYPTSERLSDAPYKYPGTNTSLYNWDKTYMGNITMRKALVQSRNIPAIKTLEKVTIPKSLEFLKGLGINLPQDEQVYASGIGASVSTEKEAAAYGAFANGGTYYKPYYVRKVVTDDGQTTKFDSTGSRAMKSSTAYMITDMLKGVFTAGTGTSAAISGIYEAGKTGTTNYSDAELAANPALNGVGIAKDAWFTGYTTHRVISIWTGYDKATTAGLNYSEQTISQQIYKQLMSYVIQQDGLTNTDWTKPSSVVATTINGTRELYVRGYAPTITREAKSSSSSRSSSTTSSKSSSRASSSTSSSVSSSSQPVQSSSSSAESSEPGTPAASSSSPQQGGRE
ncbi:PBP1A family penicillin-binding protein [Lacticaseibacillus nasuensis]|uniref:PBP1A family penicillin-binding protein n=1 Tax=Lacticaseibacillus nasuensis TaxID=944671 RepID=UPI0006D010EE|nr:PBP1A family penicillin-binding protein [Lacticaseibacillus nasuensis]